MVTVKNSELTTKTTYIVVEDPKMKAFLLKLRERSVENLKKLEEIGRSLNNGTK